MTQLEPALSVQVLEPVLDCQRKPFGQVNLRSAPIHGSRGETSTMITNACRPKPCDRAVALTSDRARRGL